MSNLSSRLKQLPFAAASLVVGGLIVCGTAYWFNYQNKLSYLISRDFRLLATLGSQTEDQISDIATKLARGADKVVPRWENDEGPTLNFTNAAGPLPRLEDVIGGLFKSKIDQGVFDTLAFATPGGQVAFAAGGHERELKGMDLAALLPEPAVAPRAGEKPLSFAERFSRKVNVQDAVVAGISYRMFMQPCCRRVKVKEESGMASEGQAGGAIVVGLVPSEALRSEAMAVSPTLVIIAALLVFLAMLAWPFLNIALQGPRQRVTQWDALQLGFSGMLGLAIITIVAITTVQCARLEHDIDGQLEGLATDLDDRLKSQIENRFRQLKEIQTVLMACQTPEHTAAVREPDCKPATGSMSSRTSSDSADFNAVFVVHKNGRQLRKAWPKEGNPPLLDVKDRGYFRYFTDVVSREAALRGTECQGEPCVLESLVSWTTGERSAVLARPTGNSEMPVAAIGFSLQPVLKAVIPPGFEFAIVDRTGHVVFHSDVERNNHENLFVETDQDRELRSLVGSGIDGGLRTDYWGRPYHAYVRHADVFGWSVVTLFDRRSIRGLMVEWTVVSLFLLLAYTVLWLTAMYFVVARRILLIWPERLRPWMWPDRFRRRRYQLLAAGYLALLTLFALVMSSADSIAGLGLVDSSHDASAIVGLAGFVIPLLACGVTFLVLSRQPAAMAGTARREPRLEYCVAVALLLTIIGILPGIAFVARSYDSHMEAYLKYRQMGLVQALNDKVGPDRLPSCDQPAEGEPVRELYGDFLYHTSLCRREAMASACDESAAGDAHAESGGRDPLTILESYLPYYSEESVKLRELLHHRADDCSWVSDRRDGSLFLEVGKGPSGHGAVVVKTTMPPLALNWFASAESTAQMAVLPAGGVAVLLVLIVLAYGIAQFMRDYVFLGQVASPPWALGRLAIPEGETVILVCDPAAMAPRIDGAEPIKLGPLIVTANPIDALRQARQRIPPDRVLLVPDLDANGVGLRSLGAKARLLGSLSESRTAAVIALSKRPLQQLAAGLRSSSPEDAAAVDELATMGGVTMLDWRVKSGPSDGPLTVSTVWPALVWWRRAWSVMSSLQPPTLLQWQHPEGGPRPAELSPAAALLHAEERAYPALRNICAEIRQLESFRAERMGPAEVLEEIDERAEAIYEDLWDGCSDDEKLALRHIAQFGLANSRNRRAVRRLIAKRLVTKDPDLRLMNQSFERFVLSRDHSASVDIARIEGEIPESTWDRLRTPLVLASVVVAVFLFTTQRDMFNTTVGALVGISTAAPSLLKLISLVARRDSSRPGQGTA